MASNQRPSPGSPFQKENSVWKFYDYPEGIRIEAGEYLTEHDAKDASIKVLRIWIANGCGDGPISVIN
jgi:hypothetical protein